MLSEKIFLKIYSETLLNSFLCVSVMKSSDTSWSEASLDGTGTITDIHTNTALNHLMIINYYTIYSKSFLLEDIKSSLISPIPVWIQIMMSSLI